MPFDDNDDDLIDSPFYDGDMPRPVATNWRPLSRNTLRGFVDIRLPSGLMLHDCAYHQKSDSRWLSLPGRPVLDNEGRQRIGENGKKIYAPSVSIPDSTRRETFQAQVLLAVDELLEGGK